MKELKKKLDKVPYEKQMFQQQIITLKQINLSMKKYKRTGTKWLAPWHKT